MNITYKVQKDGLYLKHISAKNQTENICLLAVKQNGYALEFVKNQTENICLEAVKQNSYTLKHVKNQTENICLEAVKKKGIVLQYVVKQTEEICIRAIKDEGIAIVYVKNQTKNICIEAVKKNIYLLAYINHKYIAFIKEYVINNNLLDRDKNLDFIKYNDSLILYDLIISNKMYRHNCYWGNYDWGIKYILPQDKKMCLLLVSLNILNEKHINANNKKICLYIIKLHKKMFFHLDKQNIETYALMHNTPYYGLYFKYKLPKY